MKREARLLLQRACDSLVLSIEFFNRPHDIGRVNATLILLDHAFEMLLKAAILHRGGRIRGKGANETIGFDACVRRGLSTGTVKFLEEEQALVLQTVNGLRDAAQHHFLEITEGQLYIHAQAGVTLFRDLLKSVFDQELADHLPCRVLPLATVPPTDLETLFEHEIDQIQKLLGPGRRRRIEASARLRPLAILDSAIKGEKGQPSERALGQIGKELTAGRHWHELFEGVAAVEITADGSGHALSLRFTKKEGIAMHLVPEGTPGASVVAMKRVSELGYYNLGARQLADNLGLTTPKLVAVVEHLGVREQPDCYKEFRIGKSVFKRYSQKAISEIQAGLEGASVDDIWKSRKVQQ